MKKILMIAAIALLAVACNKDQKAVNRLEGNWKATRMIFTTDIVSPDLIGTGVVTDASMTFTKCKLKTDEWCDLTTSITYILVAPFVEEFLYRVSGDGATLERKDDLSSITINQIEIVEMTRNTMKTKQVVSDELTIEASWEKK